MSQIQNTVETFIAQIYIGGNYDAAKKICCDYADKVGLCVTLEKVEYLYTHGDEVGVRVGFINYPRFPIDRNIIRGKSIELAELLREGLNQKSYSVVTSDETIWNSNRDVQPVVREAPVKEYVHGAFS